jgi:hypothetical protein
MYLRYSNNAAVNAKEILRLIQRAALSDGSIIFEGDDLFILSTTIEILLEESTRTSQVPKYPSL